MLIRNSDFSDTHLAHAVSDLYSCKAKSIRQSEFSGGQQWQPACFTDHRCALSWADTLTTEKAWFQIMYFLMIHIIVY